MAENSEPQSWAAQYWHYVCPHCAALLPANQLLTNQHIDRCRRLTVLLDAHEPQRGPVPTSPGDRPADQRRRVLYGEHLDRTYDFGKVTCRRCSTVILSRLNVSLDLLLSTLSTHAFHCSGGQW